MKKLLVLPVIAVALGLAWGITHPQRAQEASAPGGTVAVFQLQPHNVIPGQQLQPVAQASLVQ